MSHQDWNTITFKRKSKKPTTQKGAPTVKRSNGGKNAQTLKWIGTPLSKIESEDPPKLKTVTQDIRINLQRARLETLFHSIEMYSLYQGNPKDGPKKNSLVEQMKSQLL